MKNMVKKTGYALVTVMGSIAVIGITFTMLYTSGSQSAFNAGRLRNKAQASVYAEAGVEFAYALLRDDYENRLDPSVFRLNTDSTYTSGQELISSYGEGSFTLALKPSSNGQFVVVSSKGVCRGAEVEVEVLLEDDNWTEAVGVVVEEIPDYGDLDILKMVMATEGTASFGGTADTYGDDFVIQANGAITITGSVIVDADVKSHTSIHIHPKKITVNGDATAPTITGDGSASGGEYKKTVPKITIPEIDLTPYIRHATHYKAVKTGDKVVIDSDPLGGIWYVDGNVSVVGTVNATIIASGTITIENKCYLTATHGIAVANTGAGNNILMNPSKGKVTGMLYSGDGYFKQNGGDITGQVIAKLYATKGGNGVLKYKQYLPVYPAYGGPDDTGTPGEPQVVVAAWQK